MSLDVCLNSQLVELIILAFMALIHPLINSVQRHIPPVPLIPPAPRPVDGRRLPSPTPAGLGDKTYASLWMTDVRDYRYLLLLTVQRSHNLIDCRTEIAQTMAL